MAFVRKRGKVKTIHLPVTPSTALTLNTIVKFSSGKLIAATTGDGPTGLIGLVKKTIASTDSDYASDRLVPVEVPVEKHVEYELAVDGNLAATDLGTEYDLQDAGTVDHDATTDKIFLITKYISATKAWGFIKFNGSY